ncbi:AAA family ATPase [bacterium]|nr:AAA family ATPase [bacterium]
MAIEYPISRLLDHVSGQEKIKLLSRYFDFGLSNNDLYSAGDVEEGAHGFEDIGDDRFATLYHIQRHIARGELKRFLTDYKGTRGLSQLSKQIRDNYTFPTIKVKYKDQDYEIQKYPYSVVLKFYLDGKIGKKDRNNQQGISEIEFENFRRFKEKINLNIGDINFFVGPNNSGKSTVVKSILLLSNYLKNKNLTNLSLVNESLENTNVVTFNRALNRESKKEKKEFIKFKGKVNATDVSLTFTGNETDSILDVTELKVIFPSIKLECSFTGNDARIVMFQNNVLIDEETTDLDENRAYLLERKSVLNKKIHGLDKLSVKENIDIIDERNKIEAQLKKISVNQKETEVKNLASLEFEFSFKMLSQKSLGAVFNEIIDQNNLQKGVKEKEIVKSAREYFKNNEYDFKREVATFENEIEDLQIFHIGTNSGSQSTVLNIRDKQSPLAKVAHDYYQLKLDGIGLPENIEDYDFDDAIKRFVLDWLGDENEASKVGFGIAKDLKVEMIGGEAYTISLKDEQGDWSYLADRGMGSVQLVLLIMSIATIIKKSENLKSAPLVLVEEPEINLHPALQSKLTDFFYQVNKEFGFKFIIETHSEYIVRKSQLIGLKENLFEQEDLNPFRVIYFDKEEGPYEMRYTKDGLFHRDFGKGFYDAISEINYHIFSIDNNI